MAATFVTDIRDKVKALNWDFIYGSEVYAYMHEDYKIDKPTLALLNQTTANTRGVNGKIQTQIVTANLLLTIAGDYIKTYEEKFDSIILGIYSDWDKLLRSYTGTANCDSKYRLNSETINEVADWGPQGLDGIQITATFERVCQ